MQNHPKLDSLDIELDSLGSGQSGFTLIEIVIAIGIFAFVALGANALLVSVTDANDIALEREQNFAKLQRAMLIMERDFLQIQERAVRVQGEQNKIVIKGGELEFDSEADGIGFVRSGWQNPQLRLKRSNLQNVAYRLQEGQLQRLHTNYVDAAIGTEPKVKVLLDGVTDLKIEVVKELSDELLWSETFTDVTLPYAIAITITTDAFGEIRREFKVKA